jgi:glycosyltransferase involved in cell wall biosynthesis
MNILIFAPLSLEYGRGGEISSIELASGLSKFYKVILIDTNILPGEKSLQRRKILKELSKLHQIEKIKFATFKFMGKIFTFPYPREAIKLYKRIRDSDVVYLSITAIKTNLIFLLSNLFNRNTQFIIGYRKPFTINKFSFVNLKYRISICLFSMFKNRFYHHTLSWHAKNFLENFYKPEKIIHIIHGVDLQQFLKPKKTDTSDTLKFIYIGHLDKVHKGVDVLLDAIDLLFIDKLNLKVEFEFCGKGPLEKRLKNLIKKYPEKIRFNGYIEHNLINEYYTKNDVFLFTSRREPFGRVIIEALAAGLIIICTKTIGSVEILKGKDFAFFIKKLTSQDIKEKILQVYNLWKENPEKIKTLQEKAKKFAYDNYSVEKEIKQFKDLINKIIK